MSGQAELLVEHAGELVTVAGYSERPQRGKELGTLGMIKDGAVAVSGGMITAIGTTAEVRSQVEIDESTAVIDAGGSLVTPGLVDPHTHLVFGGSREYELAWKLAGVSYMEIHRRGGGILDTVRATRKAGREELLAAGRRYLREMLAEGTTTAEAKSGYGLNEADEVKMLEVIAELNRSQPVELIPTYLGAHAVPEEYEDNPAGYIEEMLEVVMPRVARERLAEYCDVFTEEGVFTIEESRRILKRARELGFKLKLHADEIKSLGGAELAAEMGAVSADHLMAVSGEGIERMAAAGTLAVILPATTFCLMEDSYAPARRMIERGCAVALASDFNPGSCPVNSPQVVMGIACRQLKLTPEEVLSAMTINAAHAIGRADRVGSLEVGKQGDLVIFNAPNHQYLCYRFGTNLVAQVIKRGKVVIDRR